MSIPLRISLLAWLAIGLSAPALAAAPRVTLVVCPGLTLQDLAQSQSMQAISGRVGIALLSPGNARKPDPVDNLYASLYAGDTANTKNPNRDLLMRVLTRAWPPGRAIVVPNASAEEAALIAASARGWQESVVICGLPPVNPQTNEWDRLSVVLIEGPGDWAGKTMTSDTTQTLGLVALRDIAPTVLSLAGLPIPRSMAGHPIRPAAGYERLGGMNRLAHLNQVVLLPVMWAWGIVALAALLSTLWTLSQGIVWRPALQRYLLRVMMATPLALMLAALPTPASAWGYGATILALSLALAAIPSAAVLLAVSAAAVAIDGLAGSPTISRSALSGYWISGIRFYGIGNEYMGILLGAAIVAAWAAARRWPDEIHGRLGASLLGGWFAVLIFVLSYPAFGAKAGGAVTATASFAPLWLALVRGRRIEWRGWLASVCAGFVLVLAWAALSSTLGERPTHIQAAAGDLAQGRFDAIWHMAFRKVGLAIRTATVPGVIATYLGMIPVWLLWQRTPLNERVRVFLAADPLLGAAMRASIAGSAAALLFNDSGFVAFVFVFGAPSLTLLHEMLGAGIGYHLATEKIDNDRSRRGRISERA